eukprot:m.96117 g.96117  ORF g.96117 m.96117 type:complete len:272 (+) comp21965_c0_seq1:1401-2216(+)
MLETDGPYGGGICASTSHPHHHGLSDSVYRQNQLQAAFYRRMRERNVFINQPDNFFYQGGSKTGMGYNEDQYSLPRWVDLQISRAGMYDDLYHFLPTQGWMFVPLVDYHGGGAAAAFEPLAQNLDEYEWALAQYLGAGVAACYRGFRLYDTNTTKAVVQKWVSFYQKHRQILISDVVHVRRTDMQSMDSFMHVNPSLQEKGLAMVFNPTDQTQTMNLTLPLYYTGVVTSARVTQEETGAPTVYTVNRDYSIDVPVSLAPRSLTWYLIEDAA